MIYTLFNWDEYSLSRVLIFCTDCAGGYRGPTGPCIPMQRVYIRLDMVLSTTRLQPMLRTSGGRGDGASERATMRLTVDRQGEPEHRRESGNRFRTNHRNRPQSPTRTPPPCPPVADKGTPTTCLHPYRDDYIKHATALRNTKLLYIRTTLDIRVPSLYAHSTLR